MTAEVGIVTAAAAGVVSFLSPCVLPLVPGYVSYIGGRSLDRDGSGSGGRLSALLLSACFVLGFSTVFIAFGASATAISHLLLTRKSEATILGGLIIVVFGLFTTGFIKMPWLQRDVRFHGDLPGGRPLGALLLGLAFGFGWTPCIGPVLGAILTVSAVSSTAATGVALLAAYSIGLGLPFLASALFTDTLSRRLKAMRSAGRFLQLGSGVVMVAMGIAMMTGTLSDFSFWLLENVPILSRIG